MGRVGDGAAGLGGPVDPLDLVLDRDRAWDGVDDGWLVSERQVLVEREQPVGGADRIRSAVEEAGDARRGKQLAEAAAVREAGQADDVAQCPAGDVEGAGAHAWVERDERSAVDAAE